MSDESQHSRDTRAKSARLRSQLSGASEDDAAEIREQIGKLKASCQDEWEARQNYFHSQTLERMGY